MHETAPAGFELETRVVGAFPLVNHILKRLRFEQILRKHLPPSDPRALLPTHGALGLLLRNLVLAHAPLYSLGGWARQGLPALMGLAPDQLRLLNDDRVGRALDRLFDADRQALLPAHPTTVPQTVPQALAPIPMSRLALRCPGTVGPVGTVLPLRLPTLRRKVRRPMRSWRAPRPRGRLHDGRDAGRPPGDTGGPAHPARGCCGHPSSRDPHCEGAAGLRRLRSEVLVHLRVRALGLDWTKVRLADLDRILEVAVPWSDTRLLIAPGCRIARELRAHDPHPGRVWCVCEVLDLLLSGVGPEDARNLAGAKLAVGGAVVGARRLGSADTGQ